ncbi:hypothetical protein [Kurthia sibirica]|uniref:Uncharacterized protein n=1 Tax=Kurthia sibirica TaxID=202750 RepID=A0A2U3AKD8_9BACL|nr:hypothetical protein [Kurthia sibirica]PWI24985.1 hypothetical protein DEX24_10445 [Kurthia sibirica]GEK33109.1 hypothetical protein KSI01_06420 [Kurthia sibirica]
MAQQNNHYKGKYYTRRQRASIEEMKRGIIQGFPGDYNESISLETIFDIAAANDFKMTRNGFVQKKPLFQRRQSAIERMNADESYPYTLDDVKDRVRASPYFYDCMCDNDFRYYGEKYGFVTKDGIHFKRIL